jgi:acetylornithine deacetylase/succinyl-diaminopimelate desuccinylase-like protein
MDGLSRTPPAPESIAHAERDPGYDAQLRTTCVATMLEAGHAENALPQRARATINCRMLPGEAPERVAAALHATIDDPEAVLSPIGTATPSPAPSPLSEEVIAPIIVVTESMWPGVPVVPTMSTGATDGFFFRGAGIPTYGVSGLFVDVDDVRAHGRDERISKQSYLEGVEFLDRLVRAYCASSD